ncbi:hypothetical protein ROLI_026840 [Roseobacter fucihabitans]|uniref:Phasin domain-containing protein n=1 Tax=Roseobacter fucihabitans TaxID=1537242 RepID=A0ABZ2BU44_9RHOB|nr:phasin family protein [Roseobacter litoralis]MBC6967355.1 Phasin protein [Roseobacter litoralis]
MTKTPFDMSDMFKAFNPEAMSKVFDPSEMMKSLQQTHKGMPDLSAFIETNQRNFEAMAEANKAAAEGYRDMLAKQMEIFQSAIEPAQQKLKDAGDPATIQAGTEAMNEAVEQALSLMQKMAEATREANEKAFESIKDQAENMMGSKGS